MPKATVKSLPVLSVRIDIGAEDRIVPGKIQLLENIHSCGSISAADRAMDISYKRASDLVIAAEAVRGVFRNCGLISVALADPRSLRSSSHLLDLVSAAVSLIS